MLEGVVGYPAAANDHVPKAWRALAEVLVNTFKAHPDVQDGPKQKEHGPNFGGSSGCWMGGGVCHEVSLLIHVSELSFATYMG